MSAEGKFSYSATVSKDRSSILKLISWQILSHHKDPLVDDMSLEICSEVKQYM